MMVFINIFGLLTPIAIVLPVFFTYASVGHEPIQTILVVATGSIAFSIMTLNMALATRLPVFDRMFNGLDYVYFVHKWMGISVLAFILIHENVKIGPDKLPQPVELEKAAQQVGEIAFFLLIFLLIISFVKRIPRLSFEIPYHLWRYSHVLMGPIFAAIAFHMFFIQAPFKNTDLIGVYLSILAIVGLTCFAYTQLAPFFRKHSYRVVGLDRHSTATIVSLEPKRKGLSARAGGFAFVSFKSSGLKEPHPFTISKIGEDGSLQFSIKPLGDFTSHLRETLSVGTEATVEGGYGRFDFSRGGDAQVWVAGGIGITPFLAWSDALPDTGGPEAHLFYCVKTLDEAVGLERLKANAKRSNGFHLHVHESASDGRFDSERLISKLPIDIKAASLWFCGPKPMRIGLINGLKALGNKPRSVHFERFEFR